MDLRVYKDFQISGSLLTIFLRVLNIFDSENAITVYNDSGDPFFTFAKLEAQRINPTQYNATLDEFYTNPTFFSEPRRIEIGFSFNY
jgi:hypothetical protein